MPPVAPAHPGIAPLRPAIRRGGVPLPALLARGTDAVLARGRPWSPVVAHGPPGSAALAVLLAADRSATDHVAALLTGSAVWLRLR